MASPASSPVICSSYRHIDFHAYLLFGWLYFPDDLTPFDKGYESAFYFLHADGTLEQVLNDRKIDYSTWLGSVKGVIACIDTCPFCNFIPINLKYKLGQEYLWVDSLCIISDDEYNKTNQIPSIKASMAAHSLLSSLLRTTTLMLDFPGFIIHDPHKMWLILVHSV